MILTTSNALIPIPYTDLGLTPVFQARMIYSIFKGYGISLLELDLEQVIKLICHGGAREIGHFAYNNASKKIFEQTAKGCLMKLAKLIASKQGTKAVSESIKSIPIFGFIIWGIRFCYE